MYAGQLQPEGNGLRQRQGQGTVASNARMPSGSQGLAGASSSFRFSPATSTTCQHVHVTKNEHLQNRYEDQATTQGGGTIAANKQRVPPTSLC